MLVSNFKKKKKFKKATLVPSCTLISTFCFFCSRMLSRYSWNTPILVKKCSLCQQPSMLSKSTPSPSRNFTLRGSRAICWGRQSSAVRYLSSSTVSFSTFPERTATSAAVSPTGPEPTTSTEIRARHCLKPSRLTFTTTYRATTTKVLRAVSKARAPYFSSAVSPIPPTPAFSGCNPFISQGGRNGLTGGFQVFSDD